MTMFNKAAGANSGEASPDRPRQPPVARTIALAGNPNVGKSTLFNSLTGMHQHTGNWPGKTVGNARGICKRGGRNDTLVDLPGTYSLLAHSVEEEIARDYLCFGDADAAIVVCDATCLLRNLQLVLQILEITPNVVVCVNLMDEAARKGIRIDLALLQKRLGVPVVGTVAQKHKHLDALLQAVDTIASGGLTRNPPCTVYPAALEEAIGRIEPLLKAHTTGQLDSRWLALRLLEADETLLISLHAHMPGLFHNSALTDAIAEATAELHASGIDADGLQDCMVSTLAHTAESICRDAVATENVSAHAFDRRLDRILTSRRTGYPIMLLLLGLILWITIVGANVPSAMLSKGLFLLQDRLSEFCVVLGFPDWLQGALVQGVYRTLAWVVSVMLPPMAIFFPLFTLLEDTGYLPRIAFNLDKPFCRCKACGKQALTMCMGFGCNAVGVIGCRIIDSPRERLLAILTNSFVPCNGRFPTLIAIITMFFIGATGGLFSSVLSAALLTMLILLGIVLTFEATKLLSHTLLSGVPSAFTLELPPYRKPQIGRVIVRSVLDRTLFVLGRAAAVAAPAGLVLWLAANVHVGGASLLHHASAFLDPFGKLMGLDGVILIAFILGLPANEIVLPIILMAYMAQGSLVSVTDLTQMKQLLVSNGWTWITALNTMLFSLLHWPCSTTLLTIRKETGTRKWALLAAALPTVLGIGLCLLVAGFARLFS